MGQANYLPHLIDMARDILQVFSLAVSGWTLVVIARKIRKRQRSWMQWTPLITIVLLTIVFYILVMLDALGALAADVSATLRLATQISILIYSYNMPPVSDDK